ncbi:hypothetical protein BC936DRAFT_137659 [Jimgerdemannia flammicorona]|nr:hypothetical protein BC936DRAFT_137659 [Jimgerdemannia flammicorona]
MFYEKRAKKAWFGKSEEEVCWEQWAITITGVQPQDDRGGTPDVTQKHGEAPLAMSINNTANREREEGTHPTHYKQRREPVPFPGMRVI